jgi:hypothetical protein
MAERLVKRRREELKICVSSVWIVMRRGSMVAIG